MPEEISYDSEIQNATHFETLLDSILVEGIGYEIFIM